MTMNDAMYPKSVAERMMEEIKNDDDSSDGSDSSDYGHDNNEDKYNIEEILLFNVQQTKKTVGMKT